MSSDWEAYETVLRDLRAKKVAIEKAISAIEVLRPAETEKLRVVEGSVVTSSIATPLTIIGAAMKVLHEAGKPLHVRVILKGVEGMGVKLNSADSANMLGNILNRRSKRKGDVVRVGQGTWALTAAQLALNG